MTFRVSNGAFQYYRHSYIALHMNHIYILSNVKSRGKPFKRIDRAAAMPAYPLRLSCTASSQHVSVQVLFRNDG
jgi:hypothetical protein